MKFVEEYLNKQQFQSSITDQPNADLFLCLAIPCFNEPQLTQTLDSLWLCDRPAKSVDVIIVINASESSSQSVTDQNLKSLTEGKLWIGAHQDPKLRFHLIYKPDMPSKFAGVGLARKTGMDEAVHRFALVNNPKGVIAGFDADSFCDTNYLLKIEHHFNQNPKTDGASIYFEHPITGSVYPENFYLGIQQYELHLRYLNQALRYTGHPHAFHTVGSSFAVRMDAYVKQGGMNKRQAGEDFYFLQKIISLNQFTEINGTRVIPSPRESDRVPFGTGAAMRQFVKDESGILKTYAFQSYLDLQAFFKQINLFYEANDETICILHSHLPRSIQEFLTENNFEEELKSVKANVSSLSKFQDRFYRWFNVFKVIKYLNWSHTIYFSKGSTAMETSLLLKALGMDAPDNYSDLLEIYRKLDRQGFNPQ